MNKKIILKKGKEASIVRKHPWVFSGAIQKMDNGIANGEIVQVIDFKNAILGFGHYQMVGSISVRMLQINMAQKACCLLTEGRPSQII